MSFRDEQVLNQEEYLGDLSRREFLWAWYYMLDDGAIFPPGIKEEDDAAMLRAMSDFVASKSNVDYVPEVDNGYPVDFWWKALPRRSREYTQKNYLEKMDADRRKMLVDSNAFSWLGDDLRVLYWFWYKVKELRRDWIKPLENMLGVPFKDFVIVIFDSYRLDEQNKLLLLKAFAQQWSDIESRNRLIEWIKPSDDGMCQWALEYLNKHGFIVNDVPQGIRQAKYLSVITTLDMRIQDLAQKELFIKKMNLAWRQRKYRIKNKDKKQFNFWLEEESGAKLEQAARYVGMPKNELLDALIDKEYRRILVRKRQKYRSGI